MRCPTILDQNDDPCFIIMKRSNTTGLIIGRANEISSYVRNYYDNSNTQTSMEWAIYLCDNKSGPFSNKDDSGSAITPWHLP